MGGKYQKSRLELAQFNTLKLDKFKETFIDANSQQLMEEIKKIVTAKKHKAFQPATNAHKLFLISHLEKAKELQQQYPCIDFSEEINYFETAV